MIDRSGGTSLKLLTVIAVPKRMLWLLAPIVTYVVVVGVAYLLQDRLVFVGATWGRGEAVPAVPGVETAWLKRPGGERFRIATATPRGSVRGAIVFFVGNGEDLRSAVHWAALWAEYRLFAVIVEYPGYGDSEGQPGAESIRDAAETAAAFMRERARELDVPAFVGGSSLGSYPAVFLAAEGLADKLVLRAPPTSLGDVGRTHYPWLPVSLLLRHDFDSFELAPSVSCPVLVLHGDRDGVVPTELGRKLAAAFSGPTSFVTAEGYGHNDLSCDRDSPFGDRIHAFLFE